MSIYVHIIVVTEILSMLTFLKMQTAFWGGVEVACSYTSEGQLILPKAVAFARFIFCIGTTPLRLVPSISMYYVHLLLNIGINRTFTQTAEVLRDLFKLVKSNPGDLPQHP